LELTASGVELDGIEALAYSWALVLAALLQLLLLSEWQLQ
jgi:hypothetical protein